MWICQVNTASPYPWLAFSKRPCQRKRLGIADDYTIVVKVGKFKENIIGLQVYAFYPIE
jgi:hypothetical protein